MKLETNEQMVITIHQREVTYIRVVHRGVVLIDCALSAFMPQLLIAIRNGDVTVITPNLES